MGSTQAGPCAAIVMPARGVSIRLVMRSLLATTTSVLLMAMTGSAWSAGAARCASGAYGGPNGDFLVVVPLADSTLPGQRYVFRDGRRGSTADRASPVACAEKAAFVIGAAGKRARWPLLPIKETPTEFTSLGTRLVGRLLEPAWPMDATPPLVVALHGSEKTAAIGATTGYVLAAQGLTVFVYDKRGTGASAGDYTQNFEVLADDAVAALHRARQLAGDKVGRTGFFGGSQGGWIAPLAATKTRVDFVAVGFGLVASPIDEDREQMLEEATSAKLPDAARAKIDRLSAATGRVVASHFTEGFEALEVLRREWADEPWIDSVRGEYSVAMLRLSDADLRRVGRALFDGLGLIWDYDAVAVLVKLDVPLLWVLAADDREAPLTSTRPALQRLVASGKPIDIYVFPQTDHGMWEYTTNADGTRSFTRITDGYFRLLGDWIKGRAVGTYGRAQRDPPVR